MSSKNKDIQTLKSQIAALEGVDNQAAKAELARLKSSLADASQELDDTVRNHVYELHQSEYDDLSEDLQQALDDTIQAIEANAQKHEEVVQSMLDRLKLNWEDAALGINDVVTTSGLLISESGQTSVNAISGVITQIDTMKNSTADMVENFKAAMAEIQASAQATAINVQQIKISTDMSKKAEDAVKNNTKLQNNSSLGTTSTPAGSGKTATGAATGTNVQPAKTAGGANTNTNNKGNNVNNTPKVTYSLSVSKASVSVNAGSSVTVTAKISSTDKNAKLSATSANAKVASVSVAAKSITIKGVKAGTTTITVQYGTAKKQVSVTVKAASKTSGTGDGKAKVGDKVTYASGSYHATSYGTGASGSKYKGKQVYITKIASGKAYPYHISTGKRLGSGDLGWVKLSQLKGYAAGTQYVQKSGVYWTQENNPEMIVRKSDGAVLTKLNAGDSVIPSNLTDNLFKWGRINPESVFGKGINNNISNIAKNTAGDIHFDSLITVNGNVDRDVMNDLNGLATTLVNNRDFMNNVTNYVSRSTARDARKVGLKG